MVIFSIGLFAVPQAFADHDEVTIQNAAGSSTPGCEDTADGCFIPSVVTLSKADTEVTWHNGDTAAHTSYSVAVQIGNTIYANGGLWDSSLIMVGQSYTKSFEGFEPGTYPYACTVHPWMEGTIILEDGEPDTTPPVVTLFVGSLCWYCFDEIVPENQTLTTSNSTGYNYYFSVKSVEEDPPPNHSCSTDPSMLITTYWTGNMPYQGGSSAYLSHYHIIFPFGTTTITCTASDAAGNVGTASFTVIVTAILGDTVSPQVLVPDDITIETNNQDGASATFNPQAIDNIDELLTPTCNYTTGSIFPVGTTTVTCTATDAAGNTGIGTFAIIVTYIPPPDTTPPTISMLSDISDSTSDQNGKIITFTVTASDDVGVTSGPTCSPFSGSVFPVGTTTVTCTATDAAGNTNSSSFNVTIEFTGFSIPDWIKNVAGFWHAGDINDDSFLGAIEYLIENNIIVVPTTESGSGGGTVPSWVKNNAGWWASDQIDDETFVNALQYLIQQGLIQV